MTSSFLPKKYQDYVIKDGEFIGEFDKMYQECTDPWPESIEDLNNNPISNHTATIIRQQGFKRLFSVGSGKGLHAHWLKDKVPGLSVEGCDISKTAIAYSQKHFSDIKTQYLDMKLFRNYHFQFDVILFREILWYILPCWNDVVNVLKEKYEGKHIIIEITCYDAQSYGREYFDGPEDIIKKFPFKIKEILRHHITLLQKEGMILIFGQI